MQSGTDVTIPLGTELTLDQDVDLGVLTIQGDLKFLPQADRHLTAKSILLSGGALRVGSPDAGFTNQAVITLNGTVNPGGGLPTFFVRGITVTNNGTLELYGAPPAVTWARLGANADAGTSTLQLDRTAGWRAGDQLAIAPSDFYAWPVGDPNRFYAANAPVAATQLITLAADTTGATLPLAQPLAAPRWGTIQQYDAGLPIDERAEVANLTRNIIIEAPNDNLWQQGVGASIYVRQNQRVALDGVQLRRVGRKASVSLYPFGVGPSQTAGDVSVKRSTIVDSANRCLVMSTADNVVIEDNVCFNILGHGIAITDGLEQNNRIERNLVLNIKAGTSYGATGDIVQKHELAGANGGGASAFFIAGPRNILKDNVGADAPGNGFWLAFSNNAWGVSTGSTTSPRRLPLGTFTGNVAHSNGNLGFNLGFGSTAADGTTPEFPTDGYWPQADTGLSVSNSYATLLPATASFTSFKNGKGGASLGAVGLTVNTSVIADNHPIGVLQSPSGQSVAFTGNTLVGTTANSVTAMPATGTPEAMAHASGAYYVANNTFIRFPVMPAAQRGGVLSFAGGNYSPVVHTLARYTGNALIDSSWGFKPSSPAAPFVGDGPFWDPSGSLKGVPGSWVASNPFFTAGSCATAGIPNQTFCEANYNAIVNLETSLTMNPMPFGPVTFVRVINASDTVAQGTWTLPAASAGETRPVALSQKGLYRLEVPGQSAVNKIKTVKLRYVRGMPGPGSAIAIAYPAGTTFNIVNTNPFFPQQSQTVTAAAGLANALSSQGSQYYFGGGYLYVVFGVFPPLTLPAVSAFDYGGQTTMPADLTITAN